MKNPKRILAAASGGGHWVQLLRLRDSFDGFEVVYVSMFDNYSSSVPDSRLYTVPDASRFSKLAFFSVFIKSVIILIKERPFAIVTTGSAPMLSFVFLGRLCGARTLWIDSVANSERMSSSGRLARKIAHCTISQWPEVAAREKVEYWGSVL